MRRTNRRWWWQAAAILVLGFARCGGPAATSSPIAPTSGSSSSTYDSRVLADQPVLYLAMSTPGAGTERDQSGRGHVTRYAGQPAATAVPKSLEVMRQALG